MARYLNLQRPSIEALRGAGVSIDPRVVLIDGRQIAEMMIDPEVGLATATTYAIKRIDSDYFDEE